MPILVSIGNWLGANPLAHSPARHVCLVTPGHLSTNPRLVKEADALAAAGYQVSVVSARFIPWADAADAEFVSRPWRVHKVAFGSLAGRLSHIAQGLDHRASMLAYSGLGLLPERAFHPVYPALARAACAIKADLYIAHNLAALPAACQAAKKCGAKLGFDAEDFHSGEMNDTPVNALRIRLTREIERRYLPRCDYLTAASPGIARAYADAYGVQMPTVILNVFPKADAPAAPTPGGVAQPSPSLYWFSQTIGPDRGLETVVAAIVLARCRPSLFLRGNPAPGYQKVLTALAEQRGLEKDRLIFLAPASPGEMVRLAAEYDIGLATEIGTTVNRDICQTNKIYTYLLAGVPVLATDTSGQAEIAKEIPEAVCIYPQEDEEALARKMDELLLSPQELANARQLTWKVGQKKFNWDKEKVIFLELINSVLGQPVFTNKAPST